MFYNSSKCYGKFVNILWIIFQDFWNFCGSFFKILKFFENVQNVWTFLKLLFKHFQNFCNMLSRRHGRSWARACYILHPHAKTRYGMRTRIQSLAWARAFKFWHGHSQTNFEMRTRRKNIQHGHTYAIFDIACADTIGHPHAQEIFFENFCGNFFFNF
jgi:hypothetical protein